MSLSLGTQFGNYKIVAFLGAGAMGEVYRAHDERLGRDVAVKILPEAFGGDAERFRRFEYEARILAALTHPNIVQIHDAGEHAGRPYLVMELLEGETLRKRMQGRPMGPRRASELCREAALGLAAAHERGILHRDLKPENIFIAKGGQVKLLDFGLAKALGASGPGPLEITETLSKPGHVVGTPAYMSPEQLRGEAVGPRSDLFSLGVVLWEMITGEHPFTRSSGLETLHAILTVDPPDLPPALGVPPALERLLKACLSKEPEGRFHSAHDLAFALENLSQGSSTAIARPRRRRFRMWAWTVPAGLALAAGLVLGGLWWGRTRPPHYRRLTFQPGEIINARFGPGGLEVVYDFSEGSAPFGIHALRLDTLEESPMAFGPGQLCALTARGELAVKLEPKRNLDFLSLFQGTLALTPDRSTRPMPVAADVVAADLSPNGTLALVRYVQCGFRLECPAGQIRVDRGGLMTGLRFSRDGRYLAFQAYERQDLDLAKVSIRVLDLTDGSLRGLPIHGVPRGLAWSGRALVAGLGTPENATLVQALTLSGGVRTLAEIPGTWFVKDADENGRLLLEEKQVQVSIRVWKPDLQAADFSVKGASDLAGLAMDGRRLLIRTLSPRGLGNPTATFYARDVEEALPTNLGNGSLAALDPQGHWLALVTAAPVLTLALVPLAAPGTGATLTFPGLNELTDLQWLGDGSGLLAAASAPGRPPRIWRLDRQGGAPVPVTPEGVSSHADGIRSSPDGASFIAEEASGPVLCGRGAATPRRIPGLEPGEAVAGWSADAKGVYVLKEGVLPLTVDRLEVAGGPRRRIIVLDDHALPGQMLTNLFVAPDGRTVAANLYKIQSTLFMFEAR